jgi:hypothetical protein
MSPSEEMNPLWPMEPLIREHTLVAYSEQAAEQMRKDFPGWNIVMAEKRLPTVSRGIIELKQNRSAKRTAAKGFKREDK